MQSFSFKKTHIAQAAALLLTAAVAMPVRAAFSDSCASYPTVNTSITTAVTDTCSLKSGQSVSVTSPGGVISAAGVGVAVIGTAPISLSITNSGTITGGTDGINVAIGSGLSGIGGITNSGTISGTSTALNLANSGNAFAINNTGSITGRINLGINTLNLNGSSGVADGYILGGTGSVVNVNGTLTRSSANTIQVENINVTTNGTLGLTQNTMFSGAVRVDGTLSVAAGGRASINGSYTQGTSGILQIGVASNTSYGKLVVGGKGSTSLPANTKINVNVVGSPSLTSGTVLTDVIQAPEFAPTTFVVTDNSALFDFVANKTTSSGDHLNLTIVAGKTGGVEAKTVSANNPSGQGAGEVFDTLLNSPGDMAAVVNALGQLPTDAEVSDAVKKTLPLMVTGVKNAGFTELRGIDRIIEARQRELAGLSAGDTMESDRHLWFKPVGAWADQGDLRGVSGYKASSAGVVLGADSVVSGTTRAGAAFSYVNSKIDSNSSVAPNTAKVDGYRLIGYGSYNVDATTEVNFQGDVGMNNIRGQRVINFAGITSADSSYQSYNVHAAVGFGKSMQLNAKTSMTPSVRLDYTFMEDAAYTETGAGALNLTVDKNNSEELLAYVESKFAHELSGTSKLLANVGAGYDFLAKRSAVQAAFSGGGAKFTTTGLDVAPWSVRAGVGLMSSTKTMELTARYDVELRESANNQTLSVKLRMPF